MTAFNHPLAREAKVWRCHGSEGAGRDILVIVTTLVLNGEHCNYKADKIARLSNAARRWIAETKAAADFVLIARPQDWD